VQLFTTLQASAFQVYIAVQRPVVAAEDYIWRTTRLLLMLKVPLLLQKLGCRQLLTSTCSTPAPLIPSLDMGVVALCWKRSMVPQPLSALAAYLS
jgi:hypothetical protein